MSVLPTTGGKGNSDTNAIPGVVVGVVLVAVVVAIVMAVCLVQWKRKNYDLDSKGSHEVPLGSYIGRFTKHIRTALYLIVLLYCEYFHVILLC